MRAFHRQNIVGFFDNAERFVGARRRCAILAGVDVRQVIAHRTATDRSFDFEDGFGDLSRIGAIHFEDEECKPLRRFRADPGQFLELIDEPAYRFGNVAHP